jgi:hypothetical protein
MSYSNNHKVEDVVLTVINDGDGTQCGMSYKQRCQVAQYGLLDYQVACTRYNPTLSRKEAREAACLIQTYYQEHMKEGV